MKENKSKLGKASLATVAVSIACSVLAIGAVLIWAPPCSGLLEMANGNMMPMRCVYTGKIAVLLSLILLAVGISSLVTKRPATVAIRKRQNCRTYHF